MLRFLKYLSLVAVSVLAVFFAVKLYFIPPGGTLDIIKDQLDLATHTLEKEISFPAPLRLPEKEIQSGILSVPGIIAQSNEARAAEGLKGLLEDHGLNLIAELRLEDMFARQYFAHVAADGRSAETEAEKTGYDYLAIGENLALGNFEDDEDVVTAWMESPGHRANILGEQFSRIGVAARRGVFEGKSTWIAVQIFARSASECVSPSGALKSGIEENKTLISNLEMELEALRNNLDGAKSNQKEYNRMVREYNEKVAVYNELVKTTQGFVKDYNGQVQAFNLCLESP